MERAENNLYVLSQYSANENHAGYSCLYDLNLQFEEIGAKIIPMRLLYKNDDMRFKARLRRKQCKDITLDFNAHSIPSGSTLILLIYTPRYLAALQNLKPLNRFEKIAVYFLDGFDSKSLDGINFSMLDHVDYFFFAIEEMVEDFRALGKKDSYFVPFGIDALRYAPCSFERHISLLSYGRSNTKYHRYFEREFGELDSSIMYVHSTFDTSKLFDQGEHRRLHWKTLLRSKITLCFEPVNVDRFHGRSPVLYRWFECLAAGSVILGTRPKCASANDILSWEGSTIEIEKSEPSAVEQIRQLLSDQKALDEISWANRFWALKRHDWRYRLKDIFEHIQIPIPPKLTSNISKVELAHEHLYKNLKR